MYWIGFVSGMVLTSGLWILCEIIDEWWERKDKGPHMVNYRTFEEELEKHLN